MNTLLSSLKSIGKMILQSRRPTVTHRERDGKALVIMGNGPSLADNIRDDSDLLTQADTMAVNFAGNAKEFFTLRPRYYILADPHFFTRPVTDPNVERLFANINTVEWPMTLFVPAGMKVDVNNPHVSIERFNPVGVEGWQWLERMAYRSGLGMPRPRNVLIPAIMTGLQLGYRKIIIIGADHSWTRTLSVSNDNTVVSIQPHFYKDNDEEKERVTAVYRDVRLHDILLSFHLAFKSYHSIRRYADGLGATIINATPGSFIDAFPRSTLRKEM